MNELRLYEHSVECQGSALGIECPDYKPTGTMGRSERFRKCVHCLLMEHRHRGLE